jgi:radical SAM superfamily enzyme YgiQ (UPF0313 family)
MKNFVQIILNQLKFYKFKGRVILGGPQISYVKTGLEGFYPNADVFIRGYGERPIAELLQAKDLKQAINGVHYFNEKDLGKSADISLEDISSPYLNGIIKPQPFIRWESQRGCKFRCSFCQHRETDSNTKAKKFIASDRITKEISWIKENKIINDIAVLDPIFNSGPNYMNIIKQFVGYEGKLSLQTRIEMITTPFIDAIQQINQQGGHVVLEIGLQTIHRDEQKLINRGNNMIKVNTILKQLQDSKIDTEVSIIFGLPGQTLTSFKESVQYLIDRNVPTIHAFPLMLLRGTPLYYDKLKHGLVESNELISTSIPRIQENNIPHVVESKTFTYHDWKMMAEVAVVLENEYNKTKKL